jgi:hypothetical protein
MCLIQCSGHTPCAVGKTQPVASTLCGSFSPVAGNRRSTPGNVARSILASLPIWIIMACALASSASAQDPPPPPPHLHPWGVFEPGAWKLVRVVTENFNEQGACAGASTSDSKTTLLDNDDGCVTLETRVRVEISGRRFDGEPQTIKQNYYGEPLSPDIKVKDPASAEVTIEERKFPCQVREIESANAGAKTTTTLYYSPAIPPYVLKRDSVTTAPDGKTTASETAVTVQALDMPFKISSTLHSATYVKTVQRTPKGTICTIAVICPEIPGGIVSTTSKELDPSGRLVRRSTLELIDYNAEPEKDRSLPARKRQQRTRGN